MISVYYPNTDKLDPKIHGRSQVQRKELERVHGFTNSHLCNYMQFGPDTVQNLKAESTLPQEGEKDVLSHRTVKIEISFFRAGCPDFQ